MRLTNHGPLPVRVERIALRTGRFAAAPPRENATELGPGRTVDLRLPLGQVR